MDLNLKGKTALVTGGSRGLGRAISVMLASFGARVIINYANNDAAASDVKGEIEKNGGEAVVFKAKVEDPAEIRKMFAGISEKYGRLDILINNAGVISHDRFLMMVGDDEWRHMLDVNLTGVFNCTKEALRLMIPQKYGKIVNISSVSGRRGSPGQAHYAATKAGIEGFTRSLVKEVSHYGIYVNNVSPAVLEGDLSNNASDEKREWYLGMVPLKRFGTLDEVAKTVAFVASDACSYMQGQTIILDGGLTA